MAALAVDRLFIVFDEDGSGTVDLREIVLGCSRMILGESSIEKFRLLFDAYDCDGSGAISAKELMRIAHERGGQMSENLGLVKHLIATMDSDHDKMITFAEFRAAGSAMPLLIDAFNDLLPHSVLLERHVAEINASEFGPMDWARLRQMSKFIRVKGVLNSDSYEGGFLDKATFRGLMHEFFGFDDPLLVGSMFDSMDRSGDGSVDFKEVLMGLSRAMRSASPTDRFELYFELYLLAIAFCMTYQI